MPSNRSLPSLSDDDNERLRSVCVRSSPCCVCNAPLINFEPFAFSVTNDHTQHQLFNKNANDLNQIDDLKMKRNGFDGVSVCSVAHAN